MSDIETRDEVPVPPELRHLPRHVMRLTDPRQAFLVRCLASDEEAIVVAGWRTRPISHRVRQLRDRLGGADRR